MAEKALGNSTYEDYLALEAESDVKYEYHDGFIVAMAGGTPLHGKVCGNFISAVNNALEKANKPCDIYTSDVKVHIEAINKTFYPDASVTCGEVQTSEKDKNALINPILILEVLSKSTAAFDRGDKFTYYRHLPSLQEYIIVHPSKPIVEIFYRKEADLWQIQTITTLDEVIALRSLGIEIEMRSIYRRVPGVTM